MTTDAQQQGPAGRELAPEVERLVWIAESMARWLDDAEPDCNRGNPDGGGVYPCDHCIVREMVTEADAALAALAPAQGEEASGE